jgi:hypothetical protein
MTGLAGDFQSSRLLIIDRLITEEKNEVLAWNESLVDCVCQLDARYGLAVQKLHCHRVIK